MERNFSRLVLTACGLKKIWKWLKFSDLGTKIREEHLQKKVRISLERIV